MIKDQRRKEILSAIIEEYGITAEPVGSQVLVEKYGFEFSPATVRNEMLILERQGYIFQPYTSAGRVPTDKAFRFYVNEVTTPKPLSEKERCSFERLFEIAEASPNQFIKETIRQVATFSKNLSLFCLLEKDRFFSAGFSELLKYPEFQELEKTMSIFEFFDEAEQELEILFEEIENKTSIFIGHENPIKKFREFSMITTGSDLISGERIILGILGSKRMNYAKNISLVEEATKNIKNNLK